MKRFRRTLTVLAAGLSLTASCAAFAGQTSSINVTLWDKGPDSVTLDDGHPNGYGSNGDMAMAMLGVKADVTSVPAGTLTFEVTNASKDTVHEMLLSPLLDGEAALPYVADEFRVNEEAAKHLGEVSELEPGAKGALTVNLTPGKYILYCNIPAHFMDGMWSVITVN